MSTWSSRQSMRGTSGGVPWGAAFKDQDPIGLPWGRRVRGMATSYATAATPPPPPPIISQAKIQDTDRETTSSYSNSCREASKTPQGRYTSYMESQLASNGELNVIERLRHLLDTGQFSDVNVRVGKGTEQTVFKAHRLLLATASPALYKLVYAVNTNPNSNDVTTIRLQDVEPKSFERVLKYIYTDNVAIESMNDAFATLKISKKWGLKDMESKTLDVIQKFLDDYDPSTDERKNELCELLTAIESSQKTGMLDKCIQIFVKNANKIIPCQGFIDLEEHLIRKILSHPDFQFDNMLNLFEAIRDWGMNQIVTRHMKASKLQGLVAELMMLISFDNINDADFINTVLPSDCLGKADIIAFFMIRGMEIPRDLAFNNNKQVPLLTNNGSVLEFSKVCRYRRGYKLGESEVCLEHEARFRVNKNIRLLGVVFGFMFSNTDMGVTMHCQGPWEAVQWSDMLQTYCRVSSEKMQTADVRLMFSDPVQIMAHHSYKIVVKIGRMSSGTSEVDLWGGDKGNGSAKGNDGIEFYFLKAAVDPSKEVEESETDNKPGMITDMLYQIDENQEINIEPRRVRQRQRPSDEETSDTTYTRRSRNISPPAYKRTRATVVTLDEDNKIYDSSSSYRNRMNSITSPVETPRSYLYSSTNRTRQDSIVSNSRDDTIDPTSDKVSSFYLRPPSSSSSSGYGSSSTRSSGGGSNLYSSSSLRESSRDSSATRYSSRFGGGSAATPSYGSSSYSSGGSSGGTTYGARGSVCRSSSSKDYTPSIYRKDNSSRSGLTSKFGTSSSSGYSPGASSYSGYSSSSRFGSSVSRR